MFDLVRDYADEPTFLIREHGPRTAVPQSRELLAPPGRMSETHRATDRIAHCIYGHCGQFGATIVHNAVIRVPHRHAAGKSSDCHGSDNPAKRYLSPVRDERDHIAVP